MHEKMQLVDEMYSMRQDVRRLNQCVDTFCQNMIHYQMMVELEEGVQALAPPEDVAKLSLYVQDVSFSTTSNSYTKHNFCNAFNYFQNLMYIFIVD